LTATLWGLSYSPWSEKARWALDHHRFAYAYKEYVPMVSEWRLRMAAKRPSGKLTVPVLIDGDKALCDSFEIARHAETYGSGAPLFPAGSKDPILYFNEESERALTAGRALVVNGSLRSPSARKEAAPKALGPLRGVMGKVGIRYFLKKYGVTPEMEQKSEEEVRAILLRTRDALSGRRYLTGGFSYADIAMAVTLQMVKPVDERFIKIGPATRDVWTQPDLAREFSDLIEWRDRLYDEHRR
jgi:glutathione S-transferase